MDFEQLLTRTDARVRDMHQLRDAGLMNMHGHFFPGGVHYPPITMYPATNPDDFLATYRPPPDDSYVLYIHIPFCMRRCTFCHYPVETGASDGAKDDYLDLLDMEIDLWLARLGKDRLKVRSVLIAGGTPTHLDPVRFRRFHEGLERRLDRSDCTQIAYDVHPEDLLGPDGMERIAIMRDFGSDRATMGLQSLDDGILKHMNRGHTAKEAYKAIDNLHAGGIPDVCIEFIFAYPGQSMEMWMETLRRGVSTGVEEIQLYRLKISPYGDSPGPIELLYNRHPERFPSSDQAIRMKQMGINYLNDNGYHENLTRVFSRKPGHISHYAADQCCQLQDCIGVGQSAFSSLRDRFSINTPDLDQYARWVREGRIPIDRGLVRSQEDSLRWHLMLPLKNSFISKDFYWERTGERVDEVFRKELDALASHGLLYEDDQIVQLTEKGRFFVDDICAQFADPQYLPFPTDSYASGPLFLSRSLPSREHRGETGVRPAELPSPACPLRTPGRPWPWTSAPGRASRRVGAV